MNFDHNISPLPPYSKEQWLPTVFLAEHPEAFGFVSEAVPVATRTLLVSADGKPSKRGMIPPTYIYPYNEANRLFESLFSEMLDSSEENLDIINRSLTGTENGYEHLVSRYAAVMAQAMTLQTMRATPSEYVSESSATEYYANRLGENIAAGLFRLRRAMADFGGLAPSAESDFSVSLAACKIENLQGDEFAINMFGAGNFKFFLLDYEGMKVLWEEKLPRIEALEPSESAPAVATKTVVLQKTMPFAVVVLSDGACDRSGDTNSASGLLRNQNALVWRERMKLEEVMLRMIVGSQSEYTFASRAVQYFSGHIVSDDSASGAFTLVGTSYDIFATECRRRLEVLEDAMTLLPDGYDTENPPSIKDFDETESAFLDDLQARYPTLRAITSATLARHIKIAIMGIINNNTAELEGDSVIPLDYIKTVYRSFDCENDSDREQLAVNQKLIAELMASNWITLRPLFCYAADGESGSSPMREENAAAYSACLEMNETLTRLAQRRTALIDSLYSEMKLCAEILEAQKEGLVHNRISEQNFDSVMKLLTENIPSAAEALREEWNESSVTARNMLAAYTAERERLFWSDVDNALVPCYEAVLDGSVGSGFWGDIKETGRFTLNDGDASDVERLLDMIQIISDSCGEMYDAITARAAVKRTVQHISGDSGWNKTCLRAMLREFSGWEDSDVARIDDSVRSEYRAMVGRWREAQTLVNKQKEAFADYYKVYTAFAQ